MSTKTLDAMLTDEQLYSLRILTVPNSFFKFIESKFDGITTRALADLMIEVGGNYDRIYKLAKSDQAVAFRNSLPHRCCIMEAVTQDHLTN